MFNAIVFLMAPPGGDEGGGVMNFVFLGAIFLVMYLFMIRPQAKKAKEQKAFLSALQKGDSVVTAGGIHGKVLKVNEDTVLIEVDANVKLKVDKSVINNSAAQAKKQ